MIFFKSALFRLATYRERQRTLESPPVLISAGLTQSLGRLFARVLLAGALFGLGHEPLQSWIDRACQTEVSTIANQKLADGSILKHVPFGLGQTLHQGNIVMQTRLVHAKFAMYRQAAPVALTVIAWMLSGPLSAGLRGPAQWLLQRVRKSLVLMRKNVPAQPASGNSDSFVEQSAQPDPAMTQIETLLLARLTRADGYVQDFRVSATRENSRLQAMQLHAEVLAIARLAQEEPVARGVRADVVQQRLQALAGSVETAGLGRTTTSRALHQLLRLADPLTGSKLLREQPESGLQPTACSTAAN